MRIDLTALAAELRDDPERIGYVLAPRNPDTDAAIAAQINAPRSPIVQPETWVNARTIMSALGPVAGAAVLETLETMGTSVPAVKWAMHFLKAPSGIDIGDPGTRALVAQLVSFGIPQANADVILALAVRVGSRAEQLWGAGAVVGERDVFAVLGA